MRERERERGRDITSRINVHENTRKLRKALFDATSGKTVVLDMSMTVHFIE